MYVIWMFKFFCWLSLLDLGLDDGELVKVDADYEDEEEDPYKDLHDVLGQFRWEPAVKQAGVI